MLYIITGLIMGLVFGVALEKSRVFEPGVIIGQFQLRSWLLIKMFLTAIATTMVVVAVLHGLGFISLHPKAAIFPATVAGGLLFGIGMAITGACPGTVLAQIGAGYRDAWAVLAGAVMGAIVYGYLEPVVSSLSSGPGKITLVDVLPLPFWLLALIAATGIATALYLLERSHPWREDLGHDYDGVPSGSNLRQKRDGGVQLRESDGEDTQAR